MNKKWEVEPYPYETGHIDDDADFFETDDDQEALEALRDAAEKALDDIEEGETLILKIRLRKAT